MADNPDPPSDAAQGKPRDPVEEYFDRLDAAFATSPTGAPSTGGAPARGAAAQDAAAEIPTLDRVLAAHVKTTKPSDAPPAAPSLVAEAFTALLALEEGEPGAKPVRLVVGDGEPPITEAFLEELTRRVIERLAPEIARDVVVQVVSEVAERLVREEIERIRNKHV